MENKIRSYIQQREMAIASVISQVGCSKSYFYEVMKGEAKPSLVKARKIADVIGVPLDELFPRED